MRLILTSAASFACSYGGGDLGSLRFFSGADGIFCCWRHDAAGKGMTGLGA